MQASVAVYLWGLRSAGMLRGVGWYLVTELSGQHLSHLQGSSSSRKWDRYAVPKCQY